MEAAKHLAILNPAAGGGRCGRQAPDAIQELRSAGLEVEVVETREPGDATRIARDAWQDGRRNFIAIGGDGTGYEIVNGLFPNATNTKDVPTLGFLPLGTGNSFLRDFTEDGAAYSLEALRDGRSRPCDVLHLQCDEGDVYYINILSFGFTAEVGALTNRRFKRLGEPGYVLAVVSKVAGLKSHVFPMAADGGRIDRSPCTFVSINNSRFTGGKMMMAPHAEIGDGNAAVVVVGKMGRLSLLRTFPKIFKGTHTEHPSVSTSKVQSIEFDLQEAIDLMIDGEVIRMTPKRLDVLPSALNVRV